jgi:hypothetical protein
MAFDSADQLADAKYPGPSFCDRRWLAFAWIAEFPGEPGESPKTASGRIQRRLQIHALSGKFHEIVSLSKGLVAPNEKRLQRLLHRLLIVEEAVLRIRRIKG